MSFVGTTAKIISLFIDICDRLQEKGPCAAKRLSDF